MYKVYARIKKNWYVIVAFSLIMLLFYTGYHGLTEAGEWIVKIGTIIAGFAVFVQIKDTKNTTVGDFVLNLQNEFTSGEYGMDIYLKCWEEYSEKAVRLNRQDVKNIVSYLTFFETLYIMYMKNIVTMENLDDLFGRRFFVVVNNNNIQRLELLVNHKYYRNIYYLYVEWKKFRLKNAKRKGEVAEFFCEGEDFAEKYELYEYVRKLNKDCEKEFQELLQAVETSLENGKFWLPISDESRAHFWEEDWTEFYGIYDKGKLIAAGALFYKDNEYGENVKALNITETRVAEIGRLMVHPNYRKKGCMKAIVRRLHMRAVEKEVICLVATAHPDNEGSNKVLMSIGMKGEKQIKKQGDYVRNIYKLDRIEKK